MVLNFIVLTLEKKTKRNHSLCFFFILKMKPSIVSWILIITLTTFTNPVVNSNENMVQTINRNQLEENFIQKINTKCIQRDNHSCMMLKLIIYMNRIFKKPSTEISENLKLIENSRGVEVPNDPEDDFLYSRAMGSDSETLGILVAEKIWKFIRTRTARYKLYENADIFLSLEPRAKLNIGLSISPYNVLEEGRGKMKNMGVIIAAIAAKVGIIAAVMIKGLLLLTGKALLVSKLALILSVVIGLRKLLSKKHVTYEVVSHPHHNHETTHPHDSYSPGWSRALDGFLEGFGDLPTKMFDAHDIVFAGQNRE